MIWMEEKRWYTPPFSTRKRMRLSWSPRLRSRLRKRQKEKNQIRRDTGKTQCPRPIGKLQ